MLVSEIHKNIVDFSHNCCSATEEIKRLIFKTRLNERLQFHVSLILLHNFSVKSGPEEGRNRYRNIIILTDF